jgi:hypothetical protein
MNIFHRHKFDPEKWEIVSGTPLAKQLISMGVPVGPVIQMGLQRVYKNSCLDCGDLVFRRTTEIE